MERVKEFLNKNPNLKINFSSLISRPSPHERFERIKEAKLERNLLKNIKNSIKTRVKLLKIKKDIENQILNKTENKKAGKSTKRNSMESNEKNSESQQISQSNFEEESGGVGGTISLSGLSEEEARSTLWKHICRKQIPKLVRSIHQGTSARIFNCKKISQAAAGLVKRQNGRLSGKPVMAARRAMKEMLSFWKRNEKEERDLRKRAEKEAAERRRIEEEQREARRQAKKLNFLITQTELYSHFVGRKQQQSDDNEIANKSSVISKETDFADVDDSVIHAEAERIAKNAAAAHQAKLQQFQTQTTPSSNNNSSSDMDFMNPSTLKDAIILEQPSLMQVSLKSYQLKGLTWLASLYEQVNI